MTKNTILRAMLLGGLIGPWAGGCATEPLDAVQPDNQGQISLDVQLAPGIRLDTVSYAITGPVEFSRTGAIPVDKSSTVSAVVGGIPQGNGYQITLRSGIAGGGGDCSGSAAFDIRPGVTVPVTVHLTCILAPGTGSVLVNGTLNVCPRIDELDATPAEVAFGSSIALQAKAIDVDHAPSGLTFHWTSTAGSVGDPAATTPSFTCTRVGRATITVAVSDGDAACATQQSVDVVCTEPAPQTPIKHVIVLIGENRTFDHTFGTYVPRDGQIVSNLLSKGIINADGTPGPNFALAAQAQAAPQSAFFIAPDSKTPFLVLPPPSTSGAPSAARTTAPPFQTIDQAR